MKQNLIIPINTFAECFNASERKRISLLKRQLQDKSTGFHCNTARAQIRTTILAGVNHTLTQKKINEIRATNPIDNWHIVDRAANISILEKFLGMSFPETLLNKKLKQLKFDHALVPYNNVTIKVVPSLIFEIELNGQKHLGACMIHLSNENKFSIEQSKIVASILYMYLGYVAQEDHFVDPSLCLCIDPHAGTVISSNNYFALDMKRVKRICEELYLNWVVAQDEMAA